MTYMKNNDDSIWSLSEDEDTKIPKNLPKTKKGRLNKRKPGDLDTEQLKLSKIISNTPSKGVIKKKDDKTTEEKVLPDFNKNFTTNKKPDLVRSRENIDIELLLDSNHNEKNSTQREELCYNQTPKRLKKLSHRYSKQIIPEIHQFKNKIEETVNSAVNAPSMQPFPKHSLLAEKNVKLSHKILKENEFFTNKLSVETKVLGQQKFLEKVTFESNIVQNSCCEANSRKQDNCVKNQRCIAPPIGRLKSINSKGNIFLNDKKMNRPDKKQKEINFTPRDTKPKLEVSKSTKRVGQILKVDKLEITQEKASESEKITDQIIESPKVVTTAPIMSIFNTKKNTRSNKLVLSAYNYELLQKYEGLEKKEKKELLNKLTEIEVPQFWERLIDDKYNHEDTLLENYNLKITNHVNALNESEIALQKILEYLTEKNLEKSLPTSRSIDYNKVSLKNSSGEYSCDESDNTVGKDCGRIREHSLLLSLEMMENLKAELDSCSSKNQLQVFRCLDQLYESETTSFSKIYNEIGQLRDNIAELYTGTS
ncbi:hypothetical protein NADFUDRAFT_49872 [Nadsonia fulvescens var. elongata DSM 6958]|uniref:Uncharacterized protein n=1 Tax=Nadsonia fulvescens var. elongata DSM 6958 TaxID=857566 RepID=A0A1E3PR71_9ASCO|nr:hypothetical protein NADFUDRAFT_49872 [Nadsonia fulvescens var. elongata DSM 6958]